MKEISGNAARIALDGLSRSHAQAATASQRIVAGPIEAEDIVSLKTAEHAFKANAAVLAATKRMGERLLDILA